MLGGSRVKARSVYELAEDGLVTEQHMREEGREGEREEHMCASMPGRFRSFR
jgi:hypothetical protein